MHAQSAPAQLRLVQAVLLALYLAMFHCRLGGGDDVFVLAAELGTSLFEIALSLFALERTLILRAMALLEAKSEAL